MKGGQHTRERIQFLYSCVSFILNGLKIGSKLDSDLAFYDEYLEIQC